MGRPVYERLRWRALGRMLALGMLAGCGGLPPPAGPQDMPGPAGVAEPAALPAPLVLTAAPARASTRSNRQLAADFLELGFELEDGRRLMRLTRLAQPVTVTLVDAPPGAEALLDPLLDRLRREAGIAIARAPAGPPARATGGTVTIGFVPAAQFARMAPGAACFVVPNATGWEDWRRNRHRPALSWARHDHRHRVAIFLPAGLPPEQMRNCLHEELAQGLGPPNDLYRLPESVFNDDDLHGVLTGFDMLMLRMWNDPALHPGMSRDQVLSRLPGLLARLNPAGGGGAGGGPLDRPSPPGWRALIATAQGAQPVARRRAAAEQALAQARRAGWRDHRLGLSLYLVGRLNLGTDPQTARAALNEAAALWHARPETALAAAHADLQLAAFALGGGQAEAALRRARAARPASRAAAAQGLSADLALIEATALRHLGQPWQSARTEGLALGRLAWAEDELRRRAAAISALAPTAPAR